MTLGPGTGAMVGGQVRSTIHNFVTGFRLPCKMTVLSLEMTTDSLSNIAMQPSSHNCPIDRSDEAISLKIKALLAVGDTPGKRSVASCVFSIVLLSGRVTVIDVVAGLTLKSGPSYDRYWGFWTKWPVVPVSAASIIGGGGRESLSDVRKANEGGEGVDTDILCSNLFCLTSTVPPAQLRFELPPHGLYLVALSTWFGPLQVHSWLGWLDEYPHVWQ